MRQQTLSPGKLGGSLGTRSVGRGSAWAGHKYLSVAVIPRADVPIVLVLLQHRMDVGIGGGEVCSRGAVLLGVVERRFGFEGVREGEGLRVGW